MMTLSDKRVLVTGANGFLGKHLVAALLKEKARVFPSDVSYRTFPGASFVKLDVTKEQDVKDAIAKVKPRVIYHLAAFPDQKPSPEVVAKTHKVNVDGMLHILKACTAVKPLLVHIGSYKQYGNQRVPFLETDEVLGKGVYALSKNEAEKLCLRYHLQYRIPVVLLRFPTLYGPGQGKDMLIPYVISTALRGGEINTTKGEQQRELLYVGDCVDSLLAVGGAASAIGEVINVGSGRGYPIKNIVERIIKLINSEVVASFTKAYRENEVMAMVGDASKAARLLGWQAATSLDEGLRKTIRWYKQYDTGR